MIVTGQLARVDALEKMKEPLYDEEYMEELIKVISEKLELSEDEFNQIMKCQPKQHTEYKTSLFNRLIRDYYHKYK